MNWSFFGDEKTSPLSRMGREGGKNTRTGEEEEEEKEEEEQEEEKDGSGEERRSKGGRGGGGAKGRIRGDEEAGSKVKRKRRLYDKTIGEWEEEENEEE